MECGFMDLKYDKVELDDNFSKFIINDDCVIVSDSKSITKLYDYFSILYNGLNNSLVLDQNVMNEAIYHMQEMNKILKVIPNDNKKNDMNFSSLKERLVFDVLNQHIVWNDPLGCLIPEEALCILLEYGDESLCDFPITTKGIKFYDLYKWFKSIFPNLYTTHTAPIGNILTIPAKITDTNILTKYNFSAFLKNKRIIDDMGGMFYLFNCVVSDMTLTNVSEELDMPTINIIKYLAIYGIDGWKKWKSFVNENHKLWGECLLKLSSNKMVGK